MVLFRTHKQTERYKTPHAQNDKSERKKFIISSESVSHQSRCCPEARCSSSGLNNAAAPNCCAAAAAEDDESPK